MPQQKVEVKFPFGGVSTDKAEDYQDPQTTRYALNVRGFDYITGRMRGGNRSGTRYYNEPLHGDGETSNDGIFAPEGVPQALANVAFDSPRIKYTQLTNNAQTHDDGTLVDPPTVQEGEEWSSGDSFTTGAYAAVTDVHGNVYVFTAQRNVEKYNADGELLHTIPASGSTASEVPQRLAVDADESIWALTTNNVTGRSTFFRFEPDEDLGYTQKYRVGVEGLCRDMVIRGSLMYGVFNDAQVQSSESSLRCYGNIHGESPIALWSKRAPNPVNGIDVNGRGDVYVTSPSNSLRGTGDQAFLDADISWTPHEIGGEGTGPVPDNGFNAEERINCWLDAYEIDLSTGTEVSEWNDTKQELTTDITSLSPFDPVHDTTGRNLRGMSVSMSEEDNEENRYSPMYKANGFASGKPGVVFDGGRTSQKSDGSTWPTGEALVSQFNSNNENRVHAQATADAQLCPIPARDELSPDAGSLAAASGTPWTLFLVVKIDADGEARCLLSSSSSQLGVGDRLGFDFKIIVNRTVSGASNNPTVENTPGSIQLLIRQDSCFNRYGAFGLEPNATQGYGSGSDRWYATEASEVNSDGVAVISLSWSGGENGSSVFYGDFVSGLGRFRVNGKDQAFWYTSEAQNGPVGSDDLPSRSFILGAPWENAFAPSSYGLNGVYGGAEDFDSLTLPSDIGIKGFKGTVSESLVLLGSSSIGGTYTDISPNKNDIKWNVFETTTTWTDGTGPTTVETAYDTEKIEAYLAYKWGFQEHLYAQHPFHPDNVGGDSGQPPESNTDLYDLAGVSAEEWEDYLQLHYDISDTDKAFGRATPILAKYSSHNGELKWAFNAPGVGLGVVASDEGDVYTIGEPVDAASEESKNPTTGNPEPDATARHTIDLGDSFTCEAVGNKTPWILNSTEYPVQNYQYPQPILDHDGDVYLPSDPKAEETSSGDVTSEEAGVFKVVGNLEEGETNTGQGQILYVIPKPTNYFQPFTNQNDSFDGSACRNIQQWGQDMGPSQNGHSAMLGQVGAHYSIERPKVAPNGLMELRGEAELPAPCLHEDVRGTQANTAAWTVATGDTTASFWNTYFTGAKPKYANLLFNHPDPHRQIIEHSNEFREAGVFGEFLTGQGSGWAHTEATAVTAKMLVGSVDTATGMEHPKAPDQTYSVIRASGLANGTNGLRLSHDVNKTVYGETHLTNGKLYCFSVFVKDDPSSTSEQMNIMLYPEAGSTSAKAEIRVNFGADGEGLSPSVTTHHTGSYSQAHFVRKIGDTGWYRLGVVLKYDSSIGSTGDLRADIRVNGDTGTGDAGREYSWFLWGPMVNRCPANYPGQGGDDSFADPAEPLTTRHAWTNATYDKVGAAPHRQNYPLFGEDGYDGRMVEGNVRRVAYNKASPWSYVTLGPSSTHRCSVPDSGHILVTNPYGLDLRDGDELFISYFTPKWKREETMYPEDEDGVWSIRTAGNADRFEVNFGTTIYCFTREINDPTTSTTQEYPQQASFKFSARSEVAYISSSLAGDTYDTRTTQMDLAEVIWRDRGEFYEVGMWMKLKNSTVNGRQHITGDKIWEQIKISPWFSETEGSSFMWLEGDVANRQFAVTEPVYTWGWQMFVNAGVSPQNDGGLTFPSTNFTDPGESGVLSVARPPEEPNYYGYEIKGPEFLYHTTDTTGTGTSGSYLTKSRVVAAEDLLGEDESARKQHVLLLTEGKLHRVYERGTFNDDGNQGIIEIPWEGQMSTAQSSVQWTQHFGKIYFADSQKYWVYDPLFGDIKELKSKKEGTIPPRGRLITSWRGRLVIARTVEDPYNWYMSAIGDPEDWNFFPPLPTAIQATAGNASNAGKAPDIINTLIPYSDDLLLIGGDRSIARMTGDPMAGGQIDIISQSIGMMYGDSHTRDPDGNIYFVSTDACVYAMSPGGQMQKISNNFVETDYLRHLDDSLFRVRLAWNHKDEGLHIFFVPSVRLLDGDAEPLAFKALFWERKNNAWWPDEFNYQRTPYAALSINGDKPNDRELLLAAIDYNEGAGTADTGWRNVVSAWGNPSTTHPMSTTDSGVSFSNDVFIDVINEHVRDGNEQFRAIALEAEMAYPTSTGSPPHAALHVSDHSDDLWINGEQVEVDLPYDTARRILRKPLRKGYAGNGAEAASHVTKGTNMGIRIRAPFSARFALESMHLIVAPTGRRIR